MISPNAYFVAAEGLYLLSHHLENKEAKTMIKNELRILMRCLDDREREIIERYHGLSYTPHTLQEIGDVFGLTKERVRQIKEKALRKLRNDSYSLLDYLSD